MGAITPAVVYKVFFGWFNGDGVKYGEKEKGRAVEPPEKEIAPLAGGNVGREQAKKKRDKNKFHVFPSFAPVCPENVYFLL
jgi:hypothetical protein